MEKHRYEVLAISVTTYTILAINHLVDLVSLVGLWQINPCRLFDAKSSLYIYIKYVWFGFVVFYSISTIVGYLMLNPLYTYISNIRGSLNKFPDFFRIGTFIDSTHMKLDFPSKYPPPAAMHLLYRSNTFWKAPWKSSCVSVSMTFVTASFISIVS